jgi:DNA topoisomerase-1
MRRSCRRCEGPRLCDDRQAKRSCRGQGPRLVAFLESFFAKYVEYDFTAALEEKLDGFSNGEISWKQVLRDFWTDFSAPSNEIKELRVTNVLDALNEMLGPLVFPPREDGSDPRSARPAAPAISR